MSKSKPPAPSQPPPYPLYKQRSWSPDTERDEAWLRRKGNRPITAPDISRSKSLTDEDLQELKGCIELGFGFGPDTNDLDPKLSDALPALGLYCAVNKQYNNGLTRSSSLSSMNSDDSIIDPADDPEMVKTRLKQWAQVVAFSVKQFSGEHS